MLDESAIDQDYETADDLMDSVGLSRMNSRQTSISPVTMKGRVTIGRG